MFEIVFPPPGEHMECIDSGPLSAGTICKLNNALLNLACSLDPVEVLTELTVAVLQSAGTGYCHIFLKRDNNWTFSIGGECSPEIHLHHPGHNQETFHSKQHAALCDTVEQTGKELLISGKNFSAGWMHTEQSAYPDTPFTFCVPLRHNEVLLGALCFDSHSSAPSLLQKTLDTIRYLSEKSGTYIHNALLHQELKQQRPTGNTDPRLDNDRSGHNLNRHNNLSALGRLATAIAHEFGNPLLGIRFLLTDLENNECIGEDRKHMIRMGLGECKRLQAMIRKLRHEQKFAAGFRHPLQLEDILRHCLDDNTLLLEEKNIEVTTDFHGDLPLTIGIREQLEQVVTNLLLNAVDAMEDNSDARLFLATGVMEKNVYFSLKDTGCGMNRITRKKIFEPFFSTKPDIEGAGLGLFVGYLIVGEHNGSLDVSSAPGEGTTVTVYLPIMAAEDPLLGKSPAAGS